MKGRYNNNPFYICKEEYYCLSTVDQVKFKPVYEKMVNLDKGVKCVFSGNHIKLRITNLHDYPFKSRAEMILDKLVDLQSRGILDANTPPDKLIDYWAVQNYEWNLMLNGVIGQFVFDDLKKYSVGTPYKTLSYLTGKDAGVHIKFYNVTAAAEKHGFHTCNKVTDEYKIEFTFQNKKVEREILKYKTFPEITEMYEKEITKAFKKVYKLLSKDTQFKIKLALGVQKDKQVIDKILSKELSFTHMTKQMNQINNEIENISNYNADNSFIMH